MSKQGPQGQLPIRNLAKLLSRCGAAGRAQADASHKDVSFVALIKGIPAAKDWSHEGELYAISQLHHRFGLPYGSDLSFVKSFHYCNCSKCRGVVIPPCQQESRRQCRTKSTSDSGRTTHPNVGGGSDDNHYKAHKELNSLIIKARSSPPRSQQACCSRRRIFV